MSLASHPPSAGKTALPWPAFPLGMGTGRLCSLNGGLPISRAAALLQHAFDLGIRFIDTAPSYGQGQAEEAIGRLPASTRNAVLICTKVGYSLGRKGDLINAAKPLVRPILPWASALRTLIASARNQADAPGGLMSVTVQPDTIRTTLDGSLRRLQRDHVDLFLLHDPSMESIAAESNHRELERLLQSGKIRCWGMSTSDGRTASRAAEVPGCSVIEVPGFPAWVDANRDLFAKCEQHGVQVVANGVLTPLTGQSHSDIDSGPAMSAAECIRYAYQLPQTKMILCGARRSAHLERNVEIMRQLIAD